MRFKFVLISLVLSSYFYEVNGQSSVLSSGNWFKIGVEEKGIYKLNNNTLQSLGINTSTIDPRNISIYGNGGGMLPQPNNTPRATDLLENAIFVSGEEDGTFDANDYILFYGDSPNKVNFDVDHGTFTYEKNLYSDTLYYFLTIKNSKGKRISSRETPGLSGAETNTFQKISIHELDRFNLVDGGRRWFGESISSGNNFTKSFSSAGLVPSSTIELNTVLMAQSFAPSSFDLFMNTVQLGSQNMDAIPDQDYEVRGNIQRSSIQINTSELSNISNGIDIEIAFNRAEGLTSVGYLDYLYLITQNQLSLIDSKLLFHTTSTSSGNSMVLSSASSSTKIWDVSNPVSVIEQEYNINANLAQFTLDESSNEFYAFEGNDFDQPILIGAISNQNLHALPASDAIFITHKNFLSEAQRLADHRSAKDGLSIEVILIDEIYNEFSSGMQDITAIRDFAKFLYDTHGQKLKYILLFGDCSYDYKGRSISQTNFVPIYEARNSLEELFAYSSDDYFGFMEESEGEWEESSAGDHTLELGVGRLPVKTIEEATTVVDKIIRYETGANSFGDWRNNIVFIADDGDSNIHQRDSDKLAKYVDTTRREFNIEKIYLDAFEQITVTTAAGLEERSPDAKNAFEKALDEGIFILNFTGHGNQSALVEEIIIDQQSIGAMTNRNRLPFFITATCNFGSYDDPLRISGGENMVLSANGGAIGLLTSTRPVFSNSNFLLNRAYYFAAMQKENGDLPRLGDVIKNTKNASLAGNNNRNFALLGDPTMRLSYPKYDLELTLVNGKPLNQADTLKAQQLTTVAGEVINNFGGLAEDFSGTVSIEVFDKESEFRTFGTQQTFPQTFKKRDVLLFKGDATVSNGLFNFSFIVPKNISYAFGQGKISMYALNEDNTEDAIGANSDLIVGGSVPPIEDTTPPEIKLYLNDTTFSSGQKVNQNPVLLAKLSDESGINISSEGFGKDIIYILDDEETVVLNENYSASLDTYKEGWVTFDMSNLAAGNHTLKLRAYDTNNNLAEEQISFLVVEGNDIKITNVFNAPNPVSAHTTFNFTHDREGEELLIRLQIINLQGRVITQQNYRFDDSPSRIENLQWDIKDSNGNRINKGIYIYKLTVQSTLDGGKNEINKRLIILN